MSTDVSPHDDVIDVRDVIARVELVEIAPLWEYADLWVGLGGAA